MRRLAPDGEDALIRRIEALERFVQGRSPTTLSTNSGYIEQGATSIPTTWTVLGYTDLALPAGFTGTGHFMVMVSVGDSFASSSNVSAQPMFRYRYADGSFSPWYAGPAINSGNSTVATASSFWAYQFNATTSQAPAIAGIQLGVNGVRPASVAELNSTSGNWHVAASVFFKRG